MNKNPGWYHEPTRHSLASKGVSTTAKSEYETVGEKKYLSQIERNLSDYDREDIIEVAKEGLDPDFAAKERLAHGKCGLYANFLHHILNVPIYKVRYDNPNHDEPTQHAVVKIDGNFYDAWGKVTDAHLENALFIPKEEVEFEKMETSVPTGPKQSDKIKRIVRHFMDRIENSNKASGKKSGNSIESIKINGKEFEKGEKVIYDHFESGTPRTAELRNIEEKETSDQAIVRYEDFHGRTTYASVDKGNIERIEE